MANLKNQRCAFLLVLFCTLNLANGQPTTTTSLAEFQKALTERVFMTESGEVLNETEMQTRNCHSLCGHCDCMGFYCVEECICECNAYSKKPEEQNLNVTETKVDTECLAIMQKNAKDLQLPFELLIQGPNANRIVRTALHLQEESHSNKTVNATDSDAINARNKRSTIVIYSPDPVELKREKRGINDNNNLDWFNELTNSFMSGGVRKGVQQKQQKQQKQQWPILSNSAKIENAERSRSSKKSKPTALYKMSTTFGSNLKKTKKPQKPDHEIYMESKKIKPESRKNLVKATKTSVVVDENRNRNSAENLADLLYTTPMKVLDQMPAAVRDAIRRVRNHEPLSSEVENEEEEEEVAAFAEDHQDSWEDQQNFAEILQDLHEQLMKKSMEQPKMKTKKSKNSKYAHINKGNFLQRLQEILANQ